MIRVLLVDDHPLLREGTRAMLDKAADIVVVGETGSGEEALVLARAAPPDLVLLDIHLPGLSGSDVARQLRRDLPAVKVLVLTGDAQEQVVRQMFAIGVHGYLLKSAASSELLAGLYAVHRGTAALSAEIAAVLAQDAARDAPLEPLTPRELQMLRLLGPGSTNKEIGAALGLSPRTVERHVYHLMVKLRAPSRTASVSIARAQGLLDAQV